MKDHFLDHIYYEFALGSLAPDGGADLPDRG
jgi:hypothetical protein